MINLEKDCIKYNNIIIKTSGCVLPYDPNIGISMPVEGMYQIIVNNKLLYEVETDFISFNIETIFNKKIYFLDIVVRSPDVEYYYELILIDNKNTTICTYPYFTPELFSNTNNIQFQFDTIDQSYEYIYAFSWKDSLSQVGKKIKFKTIDLMLPNIKSVLADYKVFVASKLSFDDSFPILGTNQQKLLSFNKLNKQYNDLDEPTDKYELMCPNNFYHYDGNVLYTNIFAGFSYQDLQSYFKLKTNSFSDLNEQQTYIANYIRSLESIIQNKTDPITEIYKMISIKSPIFTNKNVEKWILWGLIYIFLYFKNKIDTANKLILIDFLKEKYKHFYYNNDNDVVYSIQMLFPLLEEESKYRQLNILDISFIKKYISPSIFNNNYAIMLMQDTYSPELYYVAKITDIIG